MPKKHKRTSPYEDVLAVGGSVKPPKLRKPAHSESPNRPVATPRTPLTSPQANEAAAKRISIEVLEQKKMLLPYLDKIEYINVQLRQRGLLPETETPVVTSSWQTNSKERGSQDASNNAVDRKPVHELAPSPVRSRNQEPNDKEHRTQMSVTTDKLRVRYPRLCATIDAPTLRQSAPRARPINWLLRLVESIYDELTDTFVLGSKGTTPNRPEQTSSRLTESTERAFRQRLVMPFLVRQFMDQTLGLPSLADQECLDLMGNVEATLESFPQMPVFSLFLREIYDDDILLFYLFLRHLAQQSFDLQLRAKEKLAHSSGSGCAKKFIAGDMYSLVDHPLVPDGTKIVILSREACELVFQRFFIHAVDLCRPDGKVTPASTLARFMTEEKMHSLFDSSAFGKDRVSLGVFLSWGIQAFREIPEDVIAQFKYNDDGESLNGLIRLRDTISSDAKIEKWMMMYSDEERKLRNMRIEHIKMERNNSENQYRTQLRLLQNRIQLQEQELQHIQSKITAAQAQVDDVWKDVVRVPRSSPSKRLQQARDGPFSKGAQELPSVLGRFECYISRLQRKFDIETKATVMLAKPWKQQMEELQLRMVTKIQRAYRARRKARETRKKAREDLSEKIRARELQKQNELMNRKRQEALREKDMQKHRARITARKEQEEKARAAIEKKQEALIARLREEEIEQRDGERNRRLQVRMFKKWSAFLTIRRKRREANRLFLKIQFMRWRHFHREYQRIRAACRVIQRSFRRRRELRKLRKVMMMSAKRNKLARLYLQKLQMRQLQRIFNVWAEKTSQQLTLKANYQAILQKRHAYWFDRWINFVVVWKQRVLECVLLIQRVYRGRIAREVVRYHRRRVAAATSIQRIFRGIRGREIARVRKMIRSRQDTGTRAILQRIQHRQAFICLCQLHNHAHRERSIKNMAIRHRESLERNVFCGFVSYRDHKQEKRAAFLRLQYSSAVTIQRHYRRHRCEQLFHISLRYHRAAVKIQRVYRGFRGREYVKKCRWEIQAAKTVQTAWRKRRAWRLAEATKAEMILLAAYKGDFTSTRRSIENGNWYVTDAEGNGILHVAAAAGHKRLVKLCLRYYMDINAVNKHNQTALHLLLANLPPSGYEGNASMIEERVALAEYMIDHGAWHEAADDHGLTPLLLCAGLGQTEATEMLLERVANTEARSSGGMNAAQLAVEGNHFKTLRVLLASRGFNSGVNTTDTLHLLHACAGRGLVDCLRVLVEHLEVYAIQEDQFNARDDDGYTPLIYAISNSNIDAVQCLLEHGASPDIKDYFGRAPLHFAVSVGDAGSSAAVELLTTYDADVNVKDTDGDAALHMCCDRDSRLECTVLLLRHGAFIGSNALGNHPTHIAARYGAVDTLKRLIEYGADMNIKNYEGKTPLGMARMYSQSKVMQFVAVYFASDIVGDGDSELIDQEADPDADDKPDEDDEKHPVMTLEDWAHILSTAYRLGTLAEWTHYVDVTTECSFFSMDCSREGEPPFCTWDTPVEFDAALGEHWEVIRGGGTSVASRTHNSPRTIAPTDHTDYDDLLPARGGKGVQYFYHHKATSEVREAAPPIDYALLQDVVQNSKRHKMLRQRIRKVSGAASATAMEYMRFFHTFEEESAQTRAELRAAVKIQRHFRARRTTRMVRQLLYENKCAVDLQRAFRGRKARRAAADIRKEHTCATNIQAVWRGFQTRQLEKNVHHAERLAHLNRRKMTIKIQRLFRGYVARKLFYREKVVQKLGPRGYFAWEQARRRAITIQSFRVWDEMELRGEFPGVYFYCHQVTRSCSWEKPPDWQVHDRFQFEERRQLFCWGYTQAMKQSAVRLQRLWRARQARISFRLIMKSVQLMKTSERDYLEDPTNLVKMGNYVLFLHAILHEYDRARPLYARLMRMMAQRGPDVPFILFSYGIFLYVTQEDDVALVEDMILRAKLKDKQLTKYKMAYLGFFRQSMIQNPHNAESSLNYAACLQWLFEQYEESTKYYLRAIAANPRKKGIMELFQDMLNRKRQVDKAKNPSLFKPPRGVKRSREEEDELRAQYEGYELFRRWQVKQAEEDDQRRKLQYEAEKEAADRLDAAKKIQARYRRRRAMRQVNRTKNERQAALSMVELAQQKVVYDLVQESFDQVVASQPAQKSTFGGMLKTKKAAAKQMTLSIAQLDAVFRIMTHGLTDEELNAAVNDFRSQYPKLQNVNVMDMTKFAQTHPTLSTHLNARKNEKQVK